MKKSVWIMLLAFILLAAGCGKKETKEIPTISVSEEVEDFKDNDTVTEENHAVRYDMSKVENYLESVKEQSAAINDFLEYEAMTQADMNEKSQELYKLWDDALNYVWGELKTNLSEDKFQELLDEQRAWITEKENGIEEAGKEFEGGSMYSLAVNSEAARITEKRVYELYEILKQMN